MDKKRTIEYSMTEQVHIIRQQHINGYGRLFGGLLMQWIDELAGVVARRHAGTEVTTAAIDKLVFKEGAYLNDMVVLVGKLTYVGKTSMEIRVDTYVEDLHGLRKNINRAYIVMVALDSNEKPVPVPGLAMQSENEKAEWESGEKRYQLRKQRKMEGY